MRVPARNATPEYCRVDSSTRRSAQTIRSGASEFATRSCQHESRRHVVSFSTLLHGQLQRQSHPTRDIQIGDNVIAAGANVSAETKADFFFVDYRYSFLKSNEWELAGPFGVYGGTFKTSVTGKINVGGGATVSSSASTALSLPLLGVPGDWYITPRSKASSTLAVLEGRCQRQQVRLRWRIQLEREQRAALPHGQVLNARRREPLVDPTGLSNSRPSTSSLASPLPRVCASTVAPLASRLLRQIGEPCKPVTGTCPSPPQRARNVRADAIVEALKQTVSRLA